MTFSLPTDFISGAITMGYFIGAVFFLKFWRRTREALFATFAIAFCLLAANQAASSLIDGAVHKEVWIYLIRLAAFSLLILGIIIKNLRARG